jgi:iron complex transport system ATP-binding protein
MTALGLVVSNASVVADEAPILCDVSVRIDPGSFLSVIGPNGAGKSTLVRCVAGLERPTRGSVTLDGDDLSDGSRRALARRISYVPQADARVLPFTVRAFVEMGRYPHLGSWASLGADDVQAVNQALDSTDALHLEDRSMGSLSGGERQRVFIAAALAQGGEYLLLDEPTTFLDYRHQMEIVELLERLHREEGLAVVTATHDLNSTVAVSDRVLALREGRAVFQGPAHEVLSEDLLQSIYGNRFNLISGGGRELPLVVPARNGA